VCFPAVIVPASFRCPLAASIIDPQMRHDSFGFSYAGLVDEP
jgi:hypothetical protein